MSSNGTAKRPYLKRIQNVRVCSEGDHWRYCVGERVLKDGSTATFYFVVPQTNRHRPRAK